MMWCIRSWIHKTACSHVPDAPTSVVVRPGVVFHHFVGSLLCLTCRVETVNKISLREDRFRVNILETFCLIRRRSTVYFPSRFI